MGIDVKYFTRQLDATRFANTSANEAKVKLFIDIANAVCDDREAKPAEATGDVPEWFKNLAEEIYRNGWQSGTRRDHTPCEQLTRDGWNAVEAEIARRVEAKRKNWEDELHLSIAERHRLMAEVDEEHKSRIHWEGKCGDLQAEVARCDAVLDNAFDRQNELTAERDRLAVDVERLKTLTWHPSREEVSASTPFSPTTANTGNKRNEIG